MRTIGRPRLQITSLYKAEWPEHIPADRRKHGDAVCISVASRVWLVRRPRMLSDYLAARRLFYKEWPVTSGIPPRYRLWRRLGGVLHARMMNK